MTENFYQIDARRLSVRIALAAMAVAALIFVWYAVRWQVGSLLSELTSPSQPDANEIAKYAIRLAPSNAQAWWLASATEKDLFTPEKIGASLTMAEQAVRLSPRDFRLWAELGRTYEQAGETEKALSAFQYAVGLAPAYAYPHWQLGNFLVREGRPDEALAELKKTTVFNTTYRDQAYALAWNYFDNDASRVEALAADSVDAKAGLAQFFAWHGRSADALRVWDSLDGASRNSMRGPARYIAEAMNEKLTFWEGLQFAREAGIDPEARVETINNGGFEDALAAPDETLYGWKINRPDNRVEITTDASVKHSGTRSLRLIFRSYLNPGFSALWQNVAVRPNANYRLRFWARTDSLRSAGPPVIEVLNATDDKILAISKPVSTGSHDWEEFTVDFATPEVCGGLFVRSSRSYCGDNCPIVGTVWLDDFELIRN